MRTRSDRGFVAVEFVLSVAVLLLPVVLLVAAAPTWVERRHAATVIAREVATIAGESFPASTDAEAVGELLATNYGIQPDEIDVVVIDGTTRGGQLRARVSVVMPALVVPFLGGAGRWTFTTEYSVRVDDYRGRT